MENIGFKKKEETDNWTSYELDITDSNKIIFKQLLANAEKHLPGKVIQMLYDFEDERLFFKVRL